MRIVYLHGFASGPQSRKAQAFREAFHALGMEIHIPDLARDDFDHLTISAQLAVVRDLLADEPTHLIGSSMGGYLAALTAAAHPAQVRRLVLLAPAFAFPTRWPELLGAEKLHNWRETGWLEVFHYGDRANRRVHYGLYDDALIHAPQPPFTQPAAIFHGLHDQVVPISLSRDFVRAHPNAQLTELDSDHELLNVLPAIVSAGVSFLLDRPIQPGPPPLSDPRDLR